MKPSYPLQFIILFFLIISFMSCGGGSQNERLAQIDSMAAVNPIAALEALDKLNTESLVMNQADKMYYDFIGIKAKGKRRIKNESDSLVRQVVEFYESNDRDKLSEVYFYAGCAYRDLGDAPQALEYYKKALDLMPEDEYSLLKSSAYCHSGDLYRRRMMRDKAVEMYKAGFRVDSVRKDTVGMAECLAFIGQSYATNLDRQYYNDSLYSYLDRALSLALKAGNPRMVAHMCYKISLYHSEDGEYGRMKPYVQTIESYLSDTQDPDISMFYKYLMLDSLMASHQYERAKSFCDSLGVNDNLECQAKANKYLYQIYAKKGEVEKAMQYAGEYERVNDQLNLQKAQEATAQVDALYNYQLRERDNLELKTQNQRRNYTILILCAVFIVVVLTFWLYRVKQRQQKQTLLQQLTRLQQLEKIQKQQKATQKVDEVDPPSQKIDEQEIDVLSAQVNAARKDLVRRKLVESEAYALIKKRLAENKPLSESDIKIIDEAVNRICEGFHSTLYSAYNLSQMEYSVCLLLRFDLSATDISHLLNRTNSAITHSRKRLFYKLFGREGSANELDTYIMSL